MIEINGTFLVILVALSFWKILEIAIWLGGKSVRWSQAINELVWQYKQRKKDKEYSNYGK